MRILLVSEDIPYPVMGGLAKHVLTLAKALIKAGHQVDILGGDQHPIETAGEDGLFDGRFFGDLHGHLTGWKETKLGLFVPFKRPWIAKKIALCIISYSNNYDVIHYHGHYPNIAKYIPQNINFVQTRHDQGGDCIKNTRFIEGKICTLLNPSDCAGCGTTKPNTIQHYLSTIAVKKYRADVTEAFLKHKTIFVSEMLRQNFSRVSNINPIGNVLHNFVDVEKIRSIIESNQLHGKTENGQIKLFFSGVLLPHKGIPQLLEKLTPTLPKNMSLNIVGTSYLESSLRHQFANEQIIFHGWLPSSEVLKIALNSDIVLVPSIWEEPCATTIFEGLLLGKPTFALEKGGNSELQIYERFPSQLHLFQDLDTLINALVSFQPKSTRCTELDGRGGVDLIVKKLIDIYQI